MTGQHRLSRHRWRRAWDHNVHGYSTLGEVSSVGACLNIALTSGLTVPDEWDRWCPACLEALGHDPADRPADPPAARADQVSPRHGGGEDRATPVFLEDGSISPLTLRHDAV